MKRQVYQAVSALILLLFTALQTQAAEEVTYYHNDQIGSPIAATDSSGAVLWEQAYGPWGYKLTSANNERAYTGHWEDPDTGLSDYQARWYSPAIGRFTRMDPVVWDENNVKSFNRYAYANNSPYRYKDPDGRIPIDTVPDAIFVLWDIGKISVAYLTSNDELLAEGKVDLAWDSASLATPYMVAGATRLSRVLDGAGDTVRNTSRYLEGGQGFSSYRSLKKHLGPAGENKEWHHIVEQSQAKQFGAEAIHNTKNVSAIPRDIHRKISGYYSSKQPFTNGLTVRQWLRDKSFDEQYQFGREITKRFGAE